MNWTLQLNNNIALLQHKNNRFELQKQERESITVRIVRAAGSTNESEASENEQPIGKRTGCTLQQSNFYNFFVGFAHIKAFLLFLSFWILESQHCAIAWIVSIGHYKFIWRTLSVMQYEFFFELQQHCLSHELHSWCSDLEQLLCGIGLIEK